jgi:hypothetical protein
MPEVGRAHPPARHASDRLPKAWPHSDSVQLELHSRIRCSIRFIFPKFDSVRVSGRVEMAENVCGHWTSRWIVRAKPSTDQRITCSHQVEVSPTFSTVVLLDKFSSPIAWSLRGPWRSTTAIFKPCLNYILRLVQMMSTTHRDRGGAPESNLPRPTRNHTMLLLPVFSNSESSVPSKSSVDTGRMTVQTSVEPSNPRIAT